MPVKKRGPGEHHIHDQSCRSAKKAHGKCNLSVFNTELNR